MAQLKDLLVTGATRILGKVYSPEFVGKLTGNADTATKATNDHSGTNIRSNYALYNGFNFSNNGNGIYLKSTAGAGTIATSATMPAATGSAWGVVTSGAQTFGGQKTFNGLIISATGNNSGIKVGNTYITAINGELIFQNNTSIRFGTSEWDYDKWAGLKYVPGTKTIYLGIPDGSIFSANSAQTGGTLMLPAIRYLSMNGKTVIDAADSWLRINEGKAFGSGVYFGSNIVRTDGQFQVADSGTKFKADSNGNGYFANNITIAGTCPLTFYGSGNGAYTQGCVYVKNSDGIIIEVPRATEAGDGKILALKVRTRGGQPAAEYAGDRLVETDFTYNLGSTTAEFAKGFIRAIAARHLDADAVYSDNHTLYIGYGSAAYTNRTKFYYSSSLSSRTQFAEINANGLYALTRFGVNGQNTGYTFYVNGTSYFSGNIFPAGNVYIGPSGAGGYLNGSAANGGCNSIMVGDDVWLGDVNQGGIMGMKSTGNNAGFWFYNSSGTNTGKLYVDSSGNLLSNNNNLPLTNNTYNLGSSSYYWANSYVTSTHNNTVFLMNSGSSSATTSTPTALSHGRLQCYGTLAINGNTDNSGTEYVIITSGKGMSSSVADGLAIGTNTLTWQSRNIQTWNAPYLGTVGDYTRVVIALCKTSAASTALDSHCSGEIYTQRSNGLTPIYSAYFNFCSDYGAAQGANYSLFTNFENLSTAARDGEGYRACTFTYNGVTYAGLEFAQTQARDFYYHGVGNFDPFIIAYYNWNSGSALNAEINNSLAYNKVTRQNFYLKGRATNSDYSEYIGNDNKYMRFHWSGQGGQPSWLWGGNSADNMYVYNPSNFRVANADTVDDLHASDFLRYKYSNSTIDANGSLIASCFYTVQSVITNGANSNHSVLLNISNIGTPFQIQISDSSNMYLYKRYKSSGSWSSWSKMSAGYADSAGSVAWGNVSGKPSTYTPSSHTHNYAGSNSAGGAANSANALNWVAGNEIRFTKPSYTSEQDLHFCWAWADNSKVKLIKQYIFDGGDGNPTQVKASQFNGPLNGNASSASSVPWSGVTGKPSSLPASDVYAWAKASTKPSYSWGEITGKPSTFTPSSHNHSLLVTAGDNRNSNTTPNSYANNLIFQGLKANSKIGSPSGDTYSYVVGLRGWKDSSGGYAHELAFNDSGIFARRGSTTSWNVGWQKIALNRSTAMFPGISLDDNGAYIYGESNSGNILFRFRSSSSANYSYTNVSYLYNNKLGAQSANGYWGMATPYGGSGDWIRTTSNGIIPYQSGGAGAGHCGIGTSSWYFSTAYIDTVNCVNTNASGYLQANGLINTFSEYQSQKGNRDWRFGSATGSGDQNWFGWYDYTSGYHGGIYGPSHILRMNGEIQSTSANAFRAIYGNYGFIIRNDGANTYFMMTSSGDPWGSWNDNYTIFTPNGEWQVKRSPNDLGMPTSRGYVVISDSSSDRVYSISNYNTSYLKIRGGLNTYHCTYSNSDIRLKMNVKDSEVNALNTINRIKVRQFNWKKDGKHQKIGFIADELEELDEKFSIGGGYEGKTMDVKSVDTFYLMGYMVKAIQELSEQNLTLKQENDKILKEIELLKSKGENN